MTDSNALHEPVRCLTPPVPLLAVFAVSAVVPLVILSTVYSNTFARNELWLPVVAVGWVVTVCLGSWHERSHPYVGLSLSGYGNLEVVCCPLHPAGILQWSRKLTLNLQAIDRIWVGVAREVLSLADVDGGGWRYGLFESRSFPVSTIMVLQRKDDGTYYYVRSFSHLTNTRDLLAALEQHGVTVVRV